MGLFLTQTIQKMNTQAALAPNQSNYIIRAQHNETGKDFAIIVNTRGKFWYNVVGLNLFRELDSDEPAPFMYPEEWDKFFNTNEWAEHKHPTAETAFAVLSEWANKFNHTLTVLY